MKRIDATDNGCLAIIVICITVIAVVAMMTGMLDELIRNIKDL
jgi:uncharacterized protein YoxC